MRLHRVFYLLFFLASMVFSQNSLLINDTEIAPGAKSQIIVSLNNTDAVSGFQFTLKVPAGLVVKEKEVSFLDRNTDHVIYPKALGNNEYLFLGLSSSNDHFTGNSGELMSIPIEAPLSFVPEASFPLQLLKPVLSSSSGEDIGSNHQAGNLHIVFGKSPDLEVKNIGTTSSSIIPGSTFDLNWEVENLGEANAVGGWREQVSLISEADGKRYVLGNQYYENNLFENGLVNRSWDISIPKIIGFDGPVRLEVKLIPVSQMKEPTTLQANNIGVSGIVTLEKRLIITLDKSEIQENDSGGVKLTLTRSGYGNMVETFSVDADIQSTLGLPKTLSIGEGKSSDFIYLKPVDNDAYDGDKIINLVVKGSDYPEVSSEIRILENDLPALSMSYPSDYNSSVGSKIIFTLSSSDILNSDQSVSLSSDKPSRLKVPESVTIPANSRSVTFEAVVVDTERMEPSKNVEIFAQADGFIHSTVEILLEPINIPVWSFESNSDTVNEGDDFRGVELSIEREDHLDQRLVITVSTDRSGELILPTVDVVLEAGESRKYFNIGAVDNEKVEGDRVATVYAKIKFEDCNCVDADLTQNQQLSLNILDNDGLSLKLKSLKSTMKAGDKEIELTISRNTDDPELLANAVDVTLESDKPTIVLLPEVATIPAGQKEVTITYNTKIDPTILGNQAILLKANASGYQSGEEWILVSDQYKPDFAYMSLMLSNKVEAGQKLTVTSTIENQGNAGFPSISTIKYYLSESMNSLQNETLITSSVFNEPIAPGDSYEFSEEITLPNIAGDWFLVAIVNPDRAVNELNYTNNEIASPIQIQPAYQVSVALDQNVYEIQESVHISGRSLKTNGDPYPNADILVKISNQDFSRSFNIQSDANGDYELDYDPIGNESGVYEVSASMPGLDTEAQQTFQILGFDLLDKPTFIKWEPLAGLPLEKQFVLVNRSNTNYTEVKIVLPDDVGFTLEQAPLSIAAGETIPLNFKILASEASTEIKYDEIKIKIVSNEGARWNETIYFYSKNQEAKLMADPITINTTMIKGQKRLYEFYVQNIGSVDAKNVKITIPQVDWMKLTSPSVISMIPGSETAKIVLALEPTVKEEINVPISGSIVVQQEFGPSLTLPFKIETVSVSTGSLLVDATDEYTYNTETAPHLAGAEVKVKHPFTGAVIASGVTDENGLFEVPDLAEGWYTLSVSADKHNPYQNNILVDPGKTTKITAFLPYQAVTYSWEVVPTEVEDEYEVSIKTKFETNVPKPVIVMELENDQLDLEPGESRLTNLIITNHGLIAANDVRINIGDAKPKYSIKPLISSFEQLAAKSTKIVPILIKRIDNSNARFALKEGNSEEGSSECIIPLEVRATYPCDGEKELFNYTVFVDTCADEESTIDVNFPTSTLNKPNVCQNNCPPDSGGGVIPGVYVGEIQTFDIDLCDECDRSKTVAAIACASDLLDKFKGVGKTVSSILTAGNCAIQAFFDPKYQKNHDKIKDPANIPKFVLNQAVNMADRINEYTKDVTGKSLSDDALGDLKESAKEALDKMGKDKLDDLKVCDPPSCMDAINDIPAECLEDDETLKTVQKITKLVKDIESRYNKIKSDIFNFIGNPEFSRVTSRVGYSPRELSGIEPLNTVEIFVLTEEVEIFLDQEIAFTEEDISQLKSNLEGFSISNDYIDLFTARWNNTIEAWDKGIYSPNNEYPDIVDKQKIREFYNAKNEIIQEAYQAGYTSVQEMYSDLVAQMVEETEDLEDSQGSVCATITLEFPQKLTMTREAFEGTLRINNSSSDTISEVQLDLIVTDEFGEDKTHLFQINKEAFLSGSGLVEAGQSGHGIAIFIPSKEAAPEVATSYSFGGKFSYYDPNVEERVYVTLNPVSLEVNPSPDLILHYFVQRDILGDDALTNEVIEPSIPAQLALMIHNDGYGEAKNVQVESMEPRIIENEKGLLIDFELIGSQFNNQPKELGLNTIDFGEISPKSTAIGQWFFTSSLLGHFVDYDVQVNHVSNYGNEKLSLIKASFIHELIKEVKAYGTGQDDRSDFLVNEIADSKDAPDRIYYSDGTSEEVFAADKLEVSNEVDLNHITKLSLYPNQSGWNYANIDDPAKDDYKIVRILRDRDNVEIPILNFWQTSVTLRDGATPKYEHKLHVLDYISSIETYTIYFEPIDKDLPEVVTFIDAPQENVVEQVRAIQVQFNKEINPNTFTSENIDLLYQGEFLDSDQIMIGKVNETTYSINLEALTIGSGYYELRVNALGVKDLVGNEGKNGKATHWIQIMDELGILKFESDQVKKQPINSITLTFNKPIRNEEFTAEKITINGEAVELSIGQVDDYQYIISGISSYNTEDAQYNMAIKVDEITAVDGSSGVALQEYSWSVDQQLPEIVNLEKSYQASTHAQNVTEVSFELTKSIRGDIPVSSITLMRNGTNLEIPITLIKQDDLQYKIVGLGSYTTENGEYQLSFDQSALQDEHGVFGEGEAMISWTVQVSDLDALSNIHISPDRGISDTDQITSGSDINLYYTTLESNLRVEVYELFANTEELIFEHTREEAGTYSVPLLEKFGAKRFKIIAYDGKGNSTEPEIIKVYFDIVGVEAVIETLDDEEASACIDFNEVKIEFSDDLIDLPMEAIALRSNGMEIPKDNLKVEKVDDRHFSIKNIDNPHDGNILLGLDKSKLIKKLSGLAGQGIDFKVLGNNKDYSLTINGEASPEAGKEYTYFVKEGMKKYDWIVSDGQVVSNSGHEIVIKWLNSGSRSLVLRYVSPTDCTLTTIKTIQINAVDLADNPFTVAVKDETCEFKNNGQISISVKETGNYSFALTGEGKDIKDSFTENQSIENLSEGIYKLCLSNSSEKVYTVCYELIINEPETIFVSSSIDTSRRSLKLRMDKGTPPFTIHLNQEVFTVQDRDLELSLNEGLNRVEVKTDIPCEERFVASYWIGDMAKISPNPTRGEFMLFLADDVSQNDIELAVYNQSGQLLFPIKEKLGAKQWSVDLSPYAAGIYFVDVKWKEQHQTFKVIKQ